SACFGVVRHSNIIRSSMPHTLCSTCNSPHAGATFWDDHTFHNGLPRHTAAVTRGACMHGFACYVASSRARQLSAATRPALHSFFLSPSPPVPFIFPMSES
ncbi:unnamed protein product, partial [Ectocarpus fasciculatus]